MSGGHPTHHCCPVLQVFFHGSPLKYCIFAIIFDSFWILAVVVWYVFVCTCEKAGKGKMKIDHSLLKLRRANQFLCQFPSMHVSLAGKEGTVCQNTAEPIPFCFHSLICTFYYCLSHSPLWGVQSPSG